MGPASGSLDGRSDRQKARRVEPPQLRGSSHQIGAPCKEPPFEEKPFQPTGEDCRQPRSSPACPDTRMTPGLGQSVTCHSIAQEA